MSTALATPSSDMATTNMVAAELGVSRRAVYYWYKTGKVRGERITPRLLFVSISDARQQEQRTRNSRNKRKATLMLST